jgi:hypothetical protein
MKKVLAVILGFYIGIVVFMPKKDIFYTLTYKLPKTDVIANISQTPISLDIKNAKIYYAGIKSVFLQKLTVYPLIFFNAAVLQDTKINLGNYIIKKTFIFYTPFYPFKIFVKGKGNFGNFEGFVDIKNRYVKIFFKNPKNNIKAFLQKNSKGYFYYESF